MTPEQPTAAAASKQSPGAVPPAPDKADKQADDERLQTVIGIAVVALATFLGICNVKDGNICQAMQRVKSEENDAWAWYQARNIRADMFTSTADSMSHPLPGERDESRLAREKIAANYRDKAKDQDDKKESLKAQAGKLHATYDSLNDKDDEFDFCEAALSVALAMFGITALIKRWWMLYFSFVPAAIGVFMGVAGFTELAVKELPVVSRIMTWLS